MGRITTAGAISRLPAPAGSGLTGAVTGADGALWLTVRYAITAGAKVRLRVKRGRAPIRTVATKTVKRAGIATLTWNGMLAGRKTRRGTYTLIVRATKDGRSASSRLRVRLR